MNPKDGDFVVIKGQWSNVRFSVRKIVRLTDQMYFYEGEGTGKHIRARLDEVLFSTPHEDVAKRLSEQLISSRALRDAEHRAATERMEKRQADLIATAGSLSSTQRGDAA